MLRSGRRQSAMICFCDLPRRPATVKVLGLDVILKIFCFKGHIVLISAKVVFCGGIKCFILKPGENSEMLKNAQTRNTRQVDYHDKMTHFFSREADWNIFVVIHRFPLMSFLNGNCRFCRRITTANFLRGIVESKMTCAMTILSGGALLHS